MIKMRKWEDLPSDMQNEDVRYYYNLLKKKKASIFFKRIFDIVVSFLLLVLLSPLFLILAVAIKIDSKGPVFFRQERVTAYGKIFRIFKFRTMVADAEQIGSAVTVKDDKRVTRVGKFIRKCRLDEICQLLDVFRGTMTFVGTRPEIAKYVEKYDDKMRATLLLPAGVTSRASVYFKDEEEYLKDASDIDEVYVSRVLPEKMYYNLQAIEKFSFFEDLKVMFMTVLAVLGKDYKGDFQRHTKIEKQEESEKTEAQTEEKEVHF